MVDSKFIKALPYLTQVPLNLAKLCQ